MDCWCFMLCEIRNFFISQFRYFPYNTAVWRLLCVWRKISLCRYKMWHNGSRWFMINRSCLWPVLKYSPYAHPIIFAVNLSKALCFEYCIVFRMRVFQFKCQLCKHTRIAVCKIWILCVCAHACSILYSDQNLLYTLCCVCLDIFIRQNNNPYINSNIYSLV